MHRKCQVTIVHNTAYPIGKQYKLVDGKALAEANPGRMADGIYQVYEVPNLARLNALINHMTPRHGLIMGSPTVDIDGQPAPAAGRIVARALGEQLQGAARVGVITRSQGSFSYGPWPAVIPLDLDRCPEHVISLGLLAEDLGRLLPELDCELLLRVSGSCLLRGRGVDGFLKGFKAHCYGMVENALQIKDIVRAIRLRLEPHGYVVDTAVNSPEHWVFAGPAEYGPKLVPCDATPWPVAGRPYMDAGRLLASVPAPEGYTVREVGTPSVELTDSEKRRYLSGYLPHKLSALRGWAGAAHGERHTALNGVVFACAPYWAAGLVTREALWEIVQAGAEVNCYLSKVGSRTLQAEFDRALDDGADRLELPPLMPDMTASQAFGGPAPQLPDMGGDVEACEGSPTVVEPTCVLAQWIGQWTAGERVWPDWGLFESAEGQREFEASALSQGDKRAVRKAYEAWNRRKKFANAADAIMDEMNETYAFIKDRGGKPFVMWWNDRSEECFTAVRSLHEIEANRFVTIDESKVTYSKLWMEHPNRRTYEGVVFDPANKCSENHYNLWRGFAVQPKEGDWSLMKDHIFKILAGGVEEYYDFIIRYFAWCLQNPHLAAEVALVFRGAPGCGKGATLRMINEIFGRHGFQFADPEYLFGKFSGHLERCSFLYYDEPHATGDKTNEGKLKNIITEKSIIIHPKNMQAFNAPNRLKLVMSTNSDWAVPVGTQDRRFAIFDASSERVKDKEYFIALNAEIDGGGKEAFLSAMLAFPLSDWHPRWHIPDTDAKREQAELSLPPIDSWWLNILETGELPGSVAPGRAKYEQLMQDIQRVGGRRFKDKVFRERLVTFGGLRKRTSQEKWWEFDSLASCRGRWEAVHGCRKWPDDTPSWMSAMGVAPDLRLVPSPA